MVKVNKKNRVLSSAAITAPFADGEGLTNAVRNIDNQWMVSTFSGSLFSIALQDDLTQVSPALVGTIGSRLERVAFFDARNSVIGVNSFESDDSGLRIVAPGSVSIAKFVDSSTQSAQFTTQSTSLGPHASSATKTAPQIRRPCNDRR